MTAATELDEAAIAEWRRGSEGALRVLMQPHRRQDHERILAALDEVERLRRWKAEALLALAGLQDLGRALGLPLGERITGPAAAEAARVLRAERNEARAEVESAEARAMYAEADYDARGEKLWHLATLAGHEHCEADNDASAELTIQQALARAKAAESALAAVRAVLATKFYIPSQYEEDALVYADHIEAALATPTTTERSEG